MDSKEREKHWCCGNKFYRFVKNTSQYNKKIAITYKITETIKNCSISVSTLYLIIVRSVIATYQLIGFNLLNLVYLLAFVLDVSLTEDGYIAETLYFTAVCLA